MKKTTASILAGMVFATLPLAAQAADEHCYGRITAINSSHKTVRVGETTYKTTTHVKIKINDHTATFFDLRTNMQIRCDYTKDGNTGLIHKIIVMPRGDES